MVWVLRYFNGDKEFSKVCKTLLEAERLKSKFKVAYVLFQRDD